MIPFRPIYRTLCRRPVITGLTRGRPWVHNVARYSSSTSIEQTRSKAPDAASLQLAFLEKREDPAGIFRECYRDNILTKEVAFVCLQHTDALDKLKTNTGSAALEWFWNNRNTFVEPDDNALLYLIARLMIREGEEGKLWHWMDLRVGNPKHSRAQIRSTWRGLLLKGILKTKAELQDHPLSLDDALNAYFRGKTRTTGHGIPLFPGFRYVYNLLARPLPIEENENGTASNSGDELVWKIRYPSTNLDLWSRFYEEAGREGANRKIPLRVRKHRQASLMLNHPQTPDPLPMFLVLQSIDSDSSHPWQEMAPLGAWRSQARHTQDLLLRLKKVKEAAWVEKFIEKRLSRAVVWKKEERPSGNMFREQDDSENVTSVPVTRTLPPLPPMP